MGKSENPIDAYRRQQRRKELKKNKNARIKARDAKVAATRTVDEVKAEIASLERKRDRFGKNRNGDGNDTGGHEQRSGLDSNETKRLERLQKELRIVTAESVKRKALFEQAQQEQERVLFEQQKTVRGVQKLNETKYGVLERYASVYYDENLNPFGAPPPGKPKLYYADGERNTTTMDAKLAVVPNNLRINFDLKMQTTSEISEVGSDGNVGIKKRRRLWDDKGNSNQQPNLQDGTSLVTTTATPAQDTHSHTVPPTLSLPLPPPNAHPPLVPPPSIDFPQKHPALPLPSKNFPPPPPLPPLVPQVLNPPPAPPLPPQYNQQMQPPPPPPPPPLTSPTLPPPSKAVLRAAKRFAKDKVVTTDIWASQEEMEHEKTLASAATEEIGDQNRPTQQPPLPRWQRNKSKAKKNGDDHINDPCCPSADGYADYRNRDQIERQSREATMRYREQRDHAHNVHGRLAQQQLPFNTHHPSWFYRDNSSAAIQGPFTGVQMLAWKNAGFFPSTTPVRYEQGGTNGNGTFVPISEVDFMAAPVLPPPLSSLSEQSLLLSSNRTMSVVTYPTPSIDQAEERSDDINQTSNGSVAEEDMSPKRTETGRTMPQSPSIDHTSLHVSEAEIAEPPSTGDEENELDEEGKTFCRSEENHDGDGTLGRAEGPEVDMCIPPPSDDEDEDVSEQNDNQRHGSLSHSSPVDDNSGHVTYPTDVDYPAPSGDFAPYPLDAKYNVSDDVVPYPVNVEYPITEDAYAYPDIDDACVNTNLEMASAVGPYPDGDTFGTSSDCNTKTEGESSVALAPVEKKKKEYKGDKEVVGFVPCHLHMKRRINRKIEKPAMKTKPQNPHVEKSTNAEKPENSGMPSQNRYSVADDYDKFMEEISALK